MEAHMDNTASSIFALTSKNQIVHVFLKKMQRRDKNSMQFATFYSRGIYRFLAKYIIFTFRVLAIPAALDTCVQTKSIDDQAVLEALRDFDINNHPAKFLIYSLLMQESDNMKIFAVSLAN